MFGAERPLRSALTQQKGASLAQPLPLRGGDRPRSPAEWGNTGQRVSVFSNRALLVFATHSGRRDDALYGRPAAYHYLTIPSPRQGQSL